MMDHVLVAVAAIICIACAIKWFIPARKAKKTKTTIPGLEPSDDKLGNIPDIQAAGGLHQYFTRLHRIYGPIAGWWLGQQYVVSIASPQLFKENSAVFDRPPITFEAFIPLLGRKSIQLTNGDAARKRHTAYSKCYGPQAMPQYYDNTEKLTGQLIRKWTDLPANSHIPLIESMLHFTVRAMLQSSMGAYFNNDKIVAKVVVAYQNAFSELDRRASGGVSNYNKDEEQQFEADLAYIRKTVREAIAYRRETPPVGDEYLLIDAALQVTQTEEELEDDLVTCFVGGFHTTGYALVWGLYYLAEHQDIQDKMYQEIKRVLGEESLNPETYKELTYLHQVCSEVIRCSTLGTSASRVQDVESSLGGHKIPAGTPVCHSMSVMFKDPSIYPEPDKFDPDRFSPENIKARPGYSFEPFGFAGKRKCPGYRFSQVESAFVISGILGSFEVKLVDGQNISIIHGMMNVPKEEIFITLKRRI